MKKSCILFALVLLVSRIYAQDDGAACTKEINEQVWKPFMDHLISGNMEAFSKLHSKKITRVEIDRGMIQDYNKYFQAPKNNNKNSKKYTRTFELRFDKRICDQSKAWETGFYKGTVSEDGKPFHTYFGRFFVVLEKENGTWKILVDADTGKEATEENFNKARPPE